MKLVFADRAWEDYLHWQAHEPNTLARVNSLIRERMRTPFTGTGKPEPLRGDLRGWWSRRITLSDRLVYRVTGEGAGQQLEIAQCRFIRGAQPPTTGRIIFEGMSGVERMRQVAGR